MKISTSARSPLSPKRWPADAFVWWRSLAVVAFALLALGAAVVLQVVYVLTSHAHVDPKHLVLDWNLVALQLATYVPLLPALMLGLPWAAGRPLRDLGLRRPSASEFLAGLAGGVVMYVVVAVLAGGQQSLVHLKPQEQAVDVLARAHDPGLIVAFGIIACLVAPLVEETAFRGLVFNALLRYLPLVVAAPLSGLIFGLAHGSPSALVPLAGGGIVLALVYYRTGSLASSMISHATFNLVNVGLIVLLHQT